MVRLLEGRNSSANCAARRLYKTHDPGKWVFKNTTVLGLDKVIIMKKSLPPSY